MRSGHLMQVTSEQPASTVFLEEVERFATYVGDAIVNEQINTGNSTEVLLSEKNIGKQIEAKHCLIIIILPLIIIVTMQI